MITRRSKPSVNAGTMADIAFLLLIFFLVSTTIETDQGISKVLPPLTSEITKAVVRERNIFKIELNQRNELLVNENIVLLSQLKSKVVDFLDNGGGIEEDYCSYCKGKRSPESSDNPKKAIISFKSSRKAEYAAYIAVQNELIKAYGELYEREAKRLYGVSLVTMKENLNDGRYKGDKGVLRDRIKIITKMYPEKISETEQEQQ